MYKLIRSLLFLLDPERAHHLTLKAVSLAHELGLLKTQLLTQSSMPTLMGLTFPNRIGLAAGMDRNGDYISALATFGFGFIEIGTITPSKVLGNPKPRIFRLVKDQAIINRMGFANEGLAYTVKRLQQLNYSGILGINIGKNPTTPNEQALDDYLTCFTALAPFASYITLNISSPNTVGLRELQHGEQLSRLLSAIKKAQHVFFEQSKKYVPLVLKIAPDLQQQELITIANIALSEKIDGIIATNTSVQRPNLTHVAIAAEKGGLSGRPLHALSLQIIEQLQAVLQGRIPIIACGGNMDLQCASEKLAAGASLLQMYSGFIYQGPALVQQLATL